MHKSTLSPLWFSFPGDIERFRGKRVTAELRMGRRWHFLSTGVVRVTGPDSSGRVAVDLVMATQYPRAGHEHEIVPLQAADLVRLVSTTARDCDFRYDGVLYLTDDEYEDGCLPGGAPKIVGRDNTGS
jgi:hypothetical protein